MPPEFSFCFLQPCPLGYPCFSARTALCLPRPHAVPVSFRLRMEQHLAGRPDIFFVRNSGFPPPPQLGPPPRRLPIALYFPFFWAGRGAAFLNCSIRAGLPMFPRCRFLVTSDLFPVSTVATCSSPPTGPLRSFGGPGRFSHLGLPRECRCHFGAPQFDLVNNAVVLILLSTWVRYGPLSLRFSSTHEWSGPIFLARAWRFDSRGNEKVRVVRQDLHVGCFVRSFPCVSYWLCFVLFFVRVGASVFLLYCYGSFLSHTSLPQVQKFFVLYPIHCH